MWESALGRLIVVWPEGTTERMFTYTREALRIMECEEAGNMEQVAEMVAVDEVHARLRDVVEAAALEDPLSSLAASEALLDELLVAGIVTERRAWTTAAGRSVVNVGPDLRELLEGITSSREDQRRALVWCAHDWARRRHLPHVEVSLHQALHPDEVRTSGQPTRAGSARRDTHPIRLDPIRLDHNTEATFPGYARVGVVASAAAWLPVGEDVATNRQAIDFPRWRGEWAGGDSQTIRAAATHERVRTNKGRDAEVVEPTVFDIAVELMDPVSMRLRPRTLRVRTSALTAVHPFHEAKR